MLESILLFEILKNKMGVAEKIVRENFQENKFLIQKLWAGYGELYRYYFEGNNYIIKNIKFPVNLSHPKGWNTNIGDLRKRKSYEVEKLFYQQYSDQIGEKCRLPKFFDCEVTNLGMTLVIEDLHESGFNDLKMVFTFEELKVVVSWLAKFHAINMNKYFPELWKEGTYWYLDTRKEEFDRMEDGEHKQKAKEWSDRLINCKYKTLLHGDAKYANFLWSDKGEVAAVDFQYTGKGCGMKDLIYLFSCDTSFNHLHDNLLQYYFQELSKFYEGDDVVEIIKEWHAMFEIARKDFERFLIGWSPDHWKLN